MRNKYLYILLIFSFVQIINACKSKTEIPVTEAKHPIISDSIMQLLQIDTVRLRSEDDLVKLSGEVSFDDNKVVKVYPFSSGHVLSTTVSIGDYVKAGQILATIKSADISGNYADLSISGNDVSITKRAMDNAEHLYQNGIASQKEYLEAKENYNKALSNANKIKTQIAINGGGHTTSNGTYTVASPRSGFVVEKLINPGNFIRNDNNNSLFTIGDISDVWIWANVFELDIAKVKQGYNAAVTTVAYPDKVFNGKVDKVNQILDPVTKVMKIKIVLQNKEQLLKPSMFANIVISNSSSVQSLAVPSSSIVSENGKNYVVVYKNNNDVRVQEVIIKKVVGNFNFISSGLQEGQQIITKNQILLYRKLTGK